MNGVLTILNTGSCHIREESSLVSHTQQLNAYPGYDTYYFFKFKWNHIIKLAILKWIIQWHLIHLVFVVQSLIHVQFFTNPWTASLPCPPLSPRVCSNSCLLESAMLSNHLILCRPLLLLPSIFPSCRVFSKESALCIKWPSFGASVSASALPMSIRGWFPLEFPKFALLAVQRTLKSLLQYHSSKASALLGSTFFMIQLSPVVMYRCENFDYTDLGQENDVSAFEYTKFVIAFLPRSKHPWIS